MSLGDSGASFRLQRRLQAASSDTEGHRLKPMLQAEARVTLSECL